MVLYGFCNSIHNDEIITGCHWMNLSCEFYKDKNIMVKKLISAIIGRAGYRFISDIFNEFNEKIKNNNNVTNDLVNEILSLIKEKVDEAYSKYFEDSIQIEIIKVKGVKRNTIRFKKSRFVDSLGCKEGLMYVHRDPKHIKDERNFFYGYGFVSKTEYDTSSVKLNEIEIKNMLFETMKIGILNTNEVKRDIIYGYEANENIHKNIDIICNSLNIESLKLKLNLLEEKNNFKKRVFKEKNDNYHIF